jgi:hypothetical protein
VSSVKIVHCHCRNGHDENMVISPREKGRVDVYSGVILVGTNDRFADRGIRYRDDCSIQYDPRQHTRRSDCEFAYGSFVFICVDAWMTFL